MLFAQSFGEWATQQFGLFILMIAVIFALLPKDSVKRGAKFGLIALLKALFGK